MNIAIIDADLIYRKKHRFPNLACMKISSYYKSLNHNVTLKLDYENLEEYDKVFISKVFTDTKALKKIITDRGKEKQIECSFDNIISKENVEYGGTGFFYDKATPLIYEIEHCMPDYSLYQEWCNDLLNKGTSRKELEYYFDYSIGFMTRGCIRQCSFCVNKNYKTCDLHSNLREFVDKDKKYICLLDDNVLACKDWKIIFEELNDYGKPFQFKQGMDERLLTKEKCDIIFKSKWIGDYIFAFDNIKDKNIIENKLKLIRQTTTRNIKFYVFCAFNHNNFETYDEEFWKNDICDLFERIKILMKYKCYPYIMRYKDYNISPYRGLYINIASWCNQPHMYKKKSFREFCLCDQQRFKGKGIGSTLRYMQEFEKIYPEISKKYFDMKLIDICEY